MSETDEKIAITGVFKDAESLMTALKNSKSAGIEVSEVYSPFHLRDVEELLSRSKSPVRFVTLAGAVIGLISGFALAILTALVWNMYAGGKAPAAVIPYIVVGFELTILFGAIATLIAVLVFGRLPFRKFPAKTYLPEFSKDRFGAVFGCGAVEAEEIREIIRKNGGEIR